MPQLSFHTAVTSLKDKRVLITGGTTGIGRAIGGLLASEGARVFTFGRHSMELDGALQAMRETGGDVEGVVADVASIKDVAKAFDAADRFLGGLDVLVANAGVTGEGIADMAETEWRYSVEVNLVGAMATSRAAIERMKKNGGHIILIGSVSADNRGPHSSVYVATKAGLQGFAESLRREVMEHHIKVTLVEPGSVGSDLDGIKPAEQRKSIAKQEMLRAEDIAVGVHYVLTQPPRCVVANITIRPLIEDE